MENLQPLFESAHNARKSLNLIDQNKINFLLEEIAKETEENVHYIISENQKDLQRIERDNPMYDRLMLTNERILSIVGDIRNVAKLPFPVGRMMDSIQHPKGMRITKISVPFGVIGVVYEARPNVTFDVFSLCFKSQNVCVLKGGSDAKFSNQAIVELIRNVLDRNNIDPNVCTLLPVEREHIATLLKAKEYVDLIIPRGGKSLIDFVRQNSLIPVIETGAGVCHTYFNRFGDRETARQIIFNAKTRRVSVCNSLDCLIIDKSRLDELPFLCEPLADKKVVIYADKSAFDILSTYYPKKLLKEADDSIFGIEFLDYKMAIKTVNNIDDAINHIDNYSSKHSEAIISEDKESIKLFQDLVDAACVYVNVSTGFTDGAQFGFGAEIGISTQKMHARGPMGLNELCTYKWIIEGEGQTRD